MCFHHKRLSGNINYSPSNEKNTAFTLHSTLAIAKWWVTYVCTAQLHSVKVYQIHVWTHGLAIVIMYSYRKPLTGNKVTHVKINRLQGSQMSRNVHQSNFVSIYLKHMYTQRDMLTKTSIAQLNLSFPNFKEIFRKEWRLTGKDWNDIWLAIHVEWHNDSVY